MTEYKTTLSTRKFKSLRNEYAELFNDFDLGVRFFSPEKGTWIVTHEPKFFHTDPTVALATLKGHSKALKALFPAYKLPSLASIQSNRQALHTAARQDRAWVMAEASKVEKEIARQTRETFFRYI